MNAIKQNEKKRNKKAATSNSMEFPDGWAFLLKPEPFLFMECLVFSIIPLNL